MSSAGGRRSRSAAEVLASRAGADEALGTLINQFSDPLSFLRELVQNSLDAASTRVDVDFDLEQGSGGTRLMTVTVADNGEGMNEAVIDDYLLTLFRSTKENDLTKIGKFGVGFVSIFAIEPELVVLETGQSGESWRIIFHADASYEKLRLPDPVEGTTIALHKHVLADEFSELRARGADTVRYWCKYAEAEILVDGEPVGEPFGLQGALIERRAEPGTEIVIAFPPLRAGWLEASADHACDVAALVEPLVGFYNRGLTLVEGPAAPGAPEDLAGLSIRVKSRYLEHTLTRDNVRQDESYDKVMKLVREQVRTALRPRLIAHLELLAGGDEEASRAGPTLSESLLYARLPSIDLRGYAGSAPILRTVSGAPTSLAALGPTALCAPGVNPVTELLGRAGRPVVLEAPGVLPFLYHCGKSAVSANARHYSAEPVEVSGQAGALLRALEELLDTAKARVRRVHLGDLGYADSSVAGRLCARQERPFELTTFGEDDSPTLLGGARELVIDHGHPLARACVALAERDLQLAALLLCQGIAAVERLDRERLAAVAERTIQAGEGGSR